MKSFYCLFIFISFFPVSSFSQKRNYRNEFGFRSDNDAYLFYGQDRYYTNGLFITFRHAIKMPENETKETIKKIWEIEAGQYMYNPQSGSVPDITYVDRPFTAYLYGGFRFSWLKRNEQVIRLSIEGGTIGPAALGEDAQKLLHKLVGFYPPDGWQYQLNNAPAINSALDYTRLISKTGEKTDLSFNGYAHLGTTFSGAGAGVLFRAGNIGKLFNSASTNSRISNNISDSVPQKEIFFYMQPQLHFIAYDATIEGGMFNDDKGPVTFTPNRLAFSQELGVKYAEKRWTASFSLIFRTREISTQVHAHQYGSIGLYYRFDSK